VQHELLARDLIFFVGEQQKDELVDSYLMKFERFIYMEWSAQKIPDQQCHVIM
jgi:hypothetical protein